MAWAGLGGIDLGNDAFAVSAPPREDASWPGSKDLLGSLRQPDRHAIRRVCQQTTAVSGRLDSSGAVPPAKGDDDKNPKRQRASQLPCSPVSISNKGATASASPAWNAISTGDCRQTVPGSRSGRS